jgi:hypothetical protein
LFCLERRLDKFVLKTSPRKELRDGMEELNSLQQASSESGDCVIIVEEDKANPSGLIKGGQISESFASENGLTMGPDGDHSKTDVKVVFHRQSDQSETTDSATILNAAAVGLESEDGISNCNPLCSNDMCSTSQNALGQQNLKCSVTCKSSMSSVQSNADFLKSSVDDSAATSMCSDKDSQDVRACSDDIALCSDFTPKDIQAFDDVNKCSEETEVLAGTIGNLKDSQLCSDSISGNAVNISNRVNSDNLKNLDHMRESNNVCSDLTGSSLATENVQMTVTSLVHIY